MKKSVYLKCLILAVTLLSGCALFRSSERALNSNSFQETIMVNKSISYCFEASTNAIYSWKGIVFEKETNKYIIAMRLHKIYPGSINTTELGLFFKEIGPEKTEIRVSSFNHNLAKYISEKISKYMEEEKKDEGTK